MIKVLIPWCPNTDALLPYLRKIDESRWYSNTGPLVRELESRMGGVSVSSATLGLELAALVKFKRRQVRIPALTFVATATALIRAGFEPVLCDVDADWALVDPDEQSLSVCPFGAPVRPGGLVDAAAAWGNQHEGDRVFSLHATKALSAGEGGMVCGSEELTARVRRLANFGLEAGRMGHGVVVESGTNAKMSEYHAAVALASLDSWADTRARRARLAREYKARLPWLKTLPNAGIFTTYPVEVDNAEAVAFDMASRGVETRRWYTPTLDKHPAFAHLPHEGDLGRCRVLSARLLCLPFHLYLTDSDLDQVCEVFQWATNRNKTKRTFSLITTPAESRCTARPN